jgi:hypothetical protein
MQGSKQPRFNIGRKSLQQQNDKIWSHWPISVSLNQKIECLLRKMCSWRGLEFLVPIFLSFFCNGNSTDVLFNLLLPFFYASHGQNCCFYFLVYEVLLLFLFYMGWNFFICLFFPEALTSGGPWASLSHWGKLCVSCAC